ncbi:hypothetical protein DPMN_069556 [Dreissena polymorpha]|uniref:Uncharacterized protein n=1 Tax=Dreissena polymorpha TaxID=45954 RepID=A0A9D4BUG2_DREPO|nr:hypothetical protein DPMN_069556 [Dreissena polymorpha]
MRFLEPPMRSMFSANLKLEFSLPPMDRIEGPVYYLLNEKVKKNGGTEIPD